MHDVCACMYDVCRTMSIGMCVIYLLDHEDMYVCVFLMCEVCVLDCEFMYVHVLDPDKENA
mgnify:CR=1 FL=1